MNKKASVVIVGGGISGCSVAYNLAKKGLKDIIVVDKSYISSGATGRCGAGVRMQWGTEMNCKLAKKSIDFYENANEILGYSRDVEFKQGGYLLLASTEKEMKQFNKNVELQNSLDIPSKIVSLEEAKEIVPHLNTQGLKGAAYCPKDGFLNPFKTTDAFYKAAKKLGVEFLTHTEVLKIQTNGKKIEKVVTDQGDIITDTVVNAAGGYSKLVCDMVGVDLPVYSERHQILVTEPIEPMQAPMVMSFSLNMYCQQTPEGTFVMGRGDENEPRDLRITSSWEFMDEMSKTVTSILPPLGELRVIRQWAGLYNMTPDKQPVYGRVKEVDNFFLSVGFSGHGFMFGPLTGIVISEMILGEEPSIDVSMLGIDRFEKGNLILEPSVV
ncbi:MAG: FAD-binding oxidoreductase [Eubacteriales bacterium]